MKVKKPKIIVIVGSTASGKSDLAVSLAQKFNGEVISADSRQVYRGLDIGSGKITKTEMKGIPHHLLDVADPKIVFTASDFISKGNKAIYDILKRGKVPIIVGGAGFYLSALLGEISFPKVKPNKSLRTSLKKLSNKKLLDKLRTLDQERAEEIDKHNTPRIIRAIEIAKELGSVPKIKVSVLYKTLKVGIKVKDSALQNKISKRLTSRLRIGMLAEAKRLHAKGLSYKRMIELGLEYRYMALFLMKKISKEEMLKEIEQKSWQYARRQKTWFKKDKDIKWYTLSEIRKIEKEIAQFLARPPLPAMPRT